VNLRSAVFLLLQPRPHPPGELAGKHAADTLQHSHQQNVNSSQVKREVVEKLQGEKPSSNSLSSKAKSDSQKTVAVADEVLDEAPAHPMSQSWVELTPRLDYVASAKDSRKKSSSRGSQDGFTSGKASGEVQESVVYARVSPLTYSDDNLAGKGSSSAGSKSLPSLPAVPDLSINDSYLSSFSTSQIGSAATQSLLLPNHEQSGHALVFHAPAPPPIQEAVLPPVISHPRVAVTVSSARPKTSNIGQTHREFGSSIGRSKGHPNFLQPGASNPDRQTETKTINAVESSEAESNHRNIGVCQSSVGASSIVQVSGAPVVDSSAAQISRSQHMDLLSSTGFDVTGLLKSLQQLEDLEMQAQGGGAGAGSGTNSFDRTEQDSRTSDNLTLQELSVDASDSSQQQFSMQEPAVTKGRGSGLLSSARKSAVSGQGMESKKDPFDLLTPISEETSMLLNTTKLDEEGENVVAAGLLATASQAPESLETSPASREIRQPAGGQPSLAQYVGKGSSAPSGLPAQQPTPHLAGLKSSWVTGTNRHGDPMSDLVSPQEVENSLPQKRHIEASPSNVASLEAQSGGKKGQVQGAAGRKEKGSHHRPPKTWFSLSSHLVQQ